jgi:hypothetical protein
MDYELLYKAMPFLLVVCGFWILCILGPAWVAAGKKCISKPVIEIVYDKYIIEDDGVITYYDPKTKIDVKV